MQKIVKKRLFVVLLCLMAITALCFSLVACGGETKYKVTIANYDTEQGTVTLTPEAEGNEYKEDAEVTVEAHGKGDYAVDTFTVSTDANASLDSEGKYTFTVTADTTITVTFKSTAPATVNVTDVALDQETLALEIGGLDAKAEATLQATVSPTNATNKNVSWASDAEGIATVDETGKVTAVAVGTANITVTTEDGGKTKTCVVTVSQHQHAAAAGATWQQDTENGKHYKLCECGVKVDEGTHSAAEDATYTQAGTNHTYECEVCGTTVTEAHDMSQDWSKNEEGHYHECLKCHSTERPVSHVTDSVTWTSKGTEGHSANCTVCGFEVVENHALGAKTNVGTDGHQQSCNKCDYTTEKEGHTLVYAYLGSNNHYQKCSENCGYETSTSNHDWSVGTNDDDHWAKCDTCGFQYTKDGSQVNSHTLSDWKVDSEGRHYKECTADRVSGMAIDCPYETTHEAHGEAPYSQGDVNGHYKECPTCQLHYDNGEHEFGSGKTCTVCGYERLECEHLAENLVYTSNGNGTHIKHCNACDTDLVSDEKCSYPLDEDGWYSGTGNCEHCGYQGIYTLSNTEILTYLGDFAKVKIPSKVYVRDEGGGYTKEVTITGIKTRRTSKTTKTAFANHPELTNIMIPTDSTFISLGSFVFENSGITELTLPSNVTTFSSSILKNLPELETVIIESNAFKITQNEFVNCAKLSKIIMVLPTTAPTQIPTAGINAKIYFKCDKAAFDAVSEGQWETILPKEKLYFLYESKESASTAKDSLSGFGGAWHYNGREVEEYVLE